MLKYCRVLTTSLFQTDIFCLRERDLLNRFAAEVSQRQVKGESKEYTFAVVRILSLCLSHALQ